MINELLNEFSPNQESERLDAVEDANLELHKENFLTFIQEKYFNHSSISSNAIKKARGENYLKYLKNDTVEMSAKEKHTCRSRGFCLMTNHFTRTEKLGLKTYNAYRVKDENGKWRLEKKDTFEVKEVAFIEDFHSILFIIHNKISGHSGRDKTVQQVQSRFALVPSSVIEKYIDLCPICNMKAQKSNTDNIDPIKSEKVWERVQIDLVDMRYNTVAKNGVTYNYIARVIDHFSGFNILWPLANKSGEEVAAGLEEHVFKYFGLPHILHSDSGTEFKNAIVKCLLDKWPGSCKMVHSKPRCHWIQGEIEQSNLTLQRIMASKLTETKSNDWVLILKDIMFTMNTSVYSAGRKSPYEIVFGQKPNLGLDSVIGVKEEEECENESAVNVNDFNEGEDVVDEDITGHGAIWQQVNLHQAENRERMSKQHDRKRKKKQQ